MTIRFIDVSSAQPNVNWTAVRESGVAGAFVKATEGSGYTNPFWYRYWSTLESEGMVRGAYHFARPDSGDSPEQEAGYFISRLFSLRTGDLLALDIEVGNGDLSEWCLRWLDKVQAETGVRPLIYTGGWFAPGRLTHPRLGTFPLWDSAYVGQWPAVYAPWGHITAWQYTDAAQVPGAGRVDESVFLGTSEDLRAYGKQGPHVPPPQPPPIPHPVPSTGKWAVTRDMYLRTLPRADAPHGALVRKGDVLREVSWGTLHWRHVATPGDKTEGYAYVGNIAPH